MFDTRGYTKGAIALAAVAAIAWGASLTQKDPGHPAPKPGEMLAVDPTPACVSTDPGLAPASFASAPDPRGVSARHVFDRLVEYDRRAGRIVPGLATQWEISDDGRTYTFTLRRGVVFHDVAGFHPARLFDSSDVVFTFARLMDARSPFHAVPPTAIADYATVGMPDLIASVGADGADKVVFELTVAYPKFLANLTMDFASIQSAEYAEAMKAAGTPERFGALPVGTGPLAVKAPGSADPASWSYAANSRYWADAIPKDAPKELPKQVPPPSTYGID